MTEIKPRTVYLMQRTDKIYDGTEIYVGSTSLSLKLRLQVHKSASKTKKYCNTKLYTKMREVGLNNWKIIPLLQRTCDKKTILELEMEKCNELNADLNMRSPFLGFDNKKEYFVKYYQFNKEIIKQRQDNYYELNKEKISQKQTEYHKLNKQNKRYHCEICDFSFGSNRGLKDHFYTIKHGYTYLNSLD